MGISWLTLEMLVIWAWTALRLEKRRQRRRKIRKTRKIRRTRRTRRRKVKKKRTRRAQAQAEAPFLGLKVFLSKAIVLSQAVNHLEIRCLIGSLTHLILLSLHISIPHPFPLSPRPCQQPCLLSLPIQTFFRVLSAHLSHLNYSNHQAISLLLPSHLENPHS